VLARADAVGKLAQQSQRRVAVELQRLTGVDAPPRPNLVCDRANHRFSLPANHLRQGFGGQEAGSHGLRIELRRPGLFDDAVLCRQLVIAAQAAGLAVAEAVLDIVPQIPLRLRPLRGLRRHSVCLRPLRGLRQGFGKVLSDRFNISDSDVARVLKGFDPGSIDGVRTAGPERPHERQAGQARPLGPEIDLRESGGLVIEEQGGIADQQRGVRPFDPRSRLRRHRLELRVDAPRLPAQDARESSRRARARIEADAADLRERHAREERDRGDVTVRDDPEIRNDRVSRRAAQVFDRRNHPEIDLPRVQQRGALRRHVEPEIEQIGPLVQAVDERPRIQVSNRTQATGFRHLASVRTVRSSRAARVPPP
jgi:hypothetical protein